ncbi:MAG: DNA-protecting protein DprA [Acidobacteria bacterium]|nr:DNA-protecting protein DprA [Acidobacteriota bacterium]
MNETLSPNTQAVLLLTAPLLAGRAGPSPDVLTPGEYKRLARFLQERKRQPSDLLSPDGPGLAAECGRVVDPGRLQRLLSRGFLLSQAVERWQARAIRVVSRSDAAYPQRLKSRLREDSPPLLYGCGDFSRLDAGGLAIVGSRHVDAALAAWAESAGRLAAETGRPLVSGGARGIDQAAMRGALEAGGSTVGVLADSLERSVLERENRNLLLDGRLTLVSPYDPSAGFNVGNAMQRNKLVYALSDAALVVSSDLAKGGTWSGAVEQLDKLRLVPVFVREDGPPSEGLAALRRRGALPWPSPCTPAALEAALASAEAERRKPVPRQGDLFQVFAGEPGTAAPPRDDVPADRPAPPAPDADPDPGPAPAGSAAEELFAKVRELLCRVRSPRGVTEVAEELNVLKSQAKAWLDRLVEDGVLELHVKPLRYGPKTRRSLLD